LKYHVGCSDWRYSSWTDFYPNTLDSKNYLAYYSKVFDFVEIDLSQHRSNSGNYPTLPTTKMIKKWSNETSNNFRFSLKLSTSLTNDIYKIGHFLEELAPVEEKILGIAIQQTKLALKDGREWLEEILDVCTHHSYSVALEFDHFSWYQDLTFHILKKHNAALIWSDIVGHRRHNHYPVVTADFLYLRINEHEKKWIEKIKEKEEVEGGLDFAVIIVDKPIKANTALKLLNLQ